MMSAADQVACLQEAFRNPETETELGRAVARLRQPFVIGDGKKWLYQGFVGALSALHDALRAMDDSTPPGLPAHVHDPAWIAEALGLRLEDFNWTGVREEDKTHSVVPEIRSEKLLRLKRCVALSGHSGSTLRRAIKDGRLKAHAIGRGQRRPTYGIRRSDLQEYIRASQVSPPDPPSLPTTGVKKKSRHFD
jgi:hypothetical protein